MNRTGLKKALQKSGYDRKKAMEQAINFETFEQDLSSTAKTVEDSYNGWQSRETLERNRTTVSNMKKRLDLYDRYRKEYGTDSSPDLRDVRTSYQNVLNDWGSLKSYYGDYDSAEEFQKGQEQYKKSVEWEEGLKTADVNALQKEIDVLSDILEDKAAWLYANDQNYAYYTKKLQDMGYASVDDAKAALSEKRAYKKNAEWKQKGIRLGQVANPESTFYDPNFEEKSKYDATKRASAVDEYINYDAMHDGPVASDVFRDLYANPNYIKYGYMTDQEVALFNYYLNTGGKDAADEYLHTIEEDLSGRQAAKKHEWWKDKPMWVKELYMVPAGLDQFFSAFDGDDEYNPANTTQQLSGMIRSDMGKVAGTIYDLGTTVFNMVPSIATSAVVGAVNPLAGTVVGTSLMGASAAGNAYKEKINAGWEDGQAKTFAAITGISESVLQYALGGIGKLGGVSSKLATATAGIKNAAARFALQFGGKVGSEALEEGLQEVLTPFIENMALGYEKNDWSDVDWEEAAYSALLGGLSAGVLEGGPTAVSAFSESKGAKARGQKILDKNGAKAVFDAAAKAPEGSETEKLFSAYTNKGVNAENATAEQLGRLQHRIEKEQGPRTAKVSKVQSKQTAQNGNMQNDTKTETGTPILQRVEALSKNGQAITVEEAKRASGYGDYGARVLTDFVNNTDGQSFSQVKGDMHMAYLSGLSNKKMQPKTDLQREAYFAGRQDAEMNRLKAQANAKSTNVQALEKDLIQQGVPLADRQNIVQAATEIEGSLSGTKQSVSSVVSGVRKITNNLAKVISQKVGSVQNPWGLLHTNLKALQSDKVSSDDNLVTSYTGVYLDTLRNSDPERYVEVSSGVQNVSSALEEYIRTGKMPEGVRNQEAFVSTAEDIIDIVQTAENMLGNAKEQLYGEKTSSAKDVLQSENSNGIIETSVGAKVSYALNGNTKQGKKKSGQRRFATNNQQMQVFPPYNESQSEANEISTRWAHREDVDDGAMKIAFYHDGIYLIEKTSGSDLGYRIIRKITKKEYDKWLQKNRGVQYGKDTGKQSNGKDVGQSRGGNRGNDTDGRVKSGSNRDSVRHRGKVQDVSGVDSHQEEWRGTEYERNGDYEHRFKDKQKSSGIIETSTGAKVSYALEGSADGKNEINISAIRKLILSIKGKRGLKYDGGRVIRIPNSDMETLRHKFMTEHHYSNRSNGDIDCIDCFGQGGKKHYFYVFYVGEDNRVAPIFRLDYEYIDRYVNYVQKISNEMGYNKNEFVGETSGNGKGIDRIRNIAKSDSVYDVSSAGGETDRRGGEVYNGEGGRKTTDNGSSSNGISNGYNETSNNGGIDKDITETSTGAKVSYALNGNSGSNAQPGVMWTIEEDVLAKQEVALFYREIAKINHRGSRNYQMSFDGEYIFDIENKLIYTDGNYSYPTITKVISFDSEYENDILLAKELILNEEGTQSGIDDAIEVIEMLYGQGFVLQTNFEDSRTHAREVRGRKGTDSRGTDQASEINYPLESEVKENEQSEDLLSNDGGKRKYSKSSGGQTRKVDGRSRRHKEGSEAARKRRKYCQTLKSAGHTRKRVILNHRCDVIPERHYTSEMRKIVRENSKQGIDETILVVGGIKLPEVDSNGKAKTARGMFIRTEDGRKIVVVQCDHEYYSPKQINDHELVHNDYESERTQRVKNIILKTLPIKKRNELLGIIQDDYSGILEDLEGDALEELVADILSEMHYLSEDFLELSKAYWNKDDALLKRWEYEVSKKSFAKAVENNYTSEMSRINRQLAYDEHAQLREYIVSVNNRGKEIRQTDCKEVGNNFYIWNNYGKNTYGVLFSIPIEGNEGIINTARSEISSGTYRGTENFNTRANRIRGGKRSRAVLGSRSKRASTHRGNDRLSAGQPESDTRGYSGKSSRDTSGNRIKYALDENGMWEMEHIFENDDPEAESAMMQEWNALLEKYGAIPKGENPARDVEVPKKTNDDKKVSQTVRTILEAKATPDEALPSIEKMVEDGTFSYDVYTDKQAIRDAEANIQKYGWVESLKDWFGSVEKGEVSKQITAMGWALYNNAANTVATTTSKTERDTAIRTSLDILNAMVQHQRSAAQALQATRILKKLSPETQLYGVQKSVEALQWELSDRYGDKAPNLKVDMSLAERFLKAKTQEERNEVEKEIYRDIGSQMPSRFIDKWNACRYLAMLGNLRTHGRNILGNAGFAPVVALKDLTATGIEALVNRVSGNKTGRSKSLVLTNKSGRELLKAAWGDYAKVADLISNGGKYNDSANANQYIEEGRQIFKTKPIEWARKKNSALLEREDMWFALPHYAYALAQYCKANNITAEQIKKGIAIEPARVYAIKEAQKSTYRDVNAFSQIVSRWGRTKGKNPIEKGFNTVIEGVLPFRKTPANILVRGIEYSPLGLLKGLSYDLYQVSKGNLSATEAIDNISAGLTGTGLLTLGVLLAAQGLIRGHGEDEEEEREFQELMGHQSYALELPNGTSVTLDWLAPEALPFFVGVNIWEATKGSGEEANFSSILQAVSNISEPMLEMSCLQSLNDLLESVGYASSEDTSGLVSVLASAATSYLTQGIPTLLGQAERTGEENRMTTYTEKNGFLTGDMQYTIGKVSAKIPFLEYNQIPYIDAWGRKEASGYALKRGFNNFLNPAYTSTIDASNMEKELLRLYEKTGDGAVFPARAGKYFTVDGKRKDLTADEYVRYATLKGEKSYKVIKDLVQSKAYKNLSDEEKVKAIDEAYTYADQKAKKAISNYKPDNWVNNADEFGSNVGNYLSFRANISDTKTDNGGKISKPEVVDTIMDMAQNDSDAWLMYLSMYDNENANYARSKGIRGETYMDFLDALNDADKPTKSGKYGTYTQEEAYNAIKNLRGLSRQEKAILWQSVNTTWKATNNPFR